MLRTAVLVFLAATLLSVSARAHGRVAAGPAPAQATAATSGQNPAKQTISEKIAADKTKLDINTASAAQLKALPGIGDTYAARVIAGRPYVMKTQLTKRGILPEAIYSGIADKIIARRPKK